MRSRIRSLAVALAAVAAVAGGIGCSKKPPPPPPRVHVPEHPVRVPVRERDEEKPMPVQTQAEQGSDLPPPPYQDPPLVNQRPPEQRAFVEAYESVGRPRILVFVNRTLEGEIVPVNPGAPYAGVDRNYSSRDGRDRAEAYLHPGEYDEASARAIDYGAMENILTDWLASDGRVEVVSPVMARQRMTDEQVKDLQAGRPRAMGELARQLDADVLIQVQARPTKQTANGLGVRVMAESVNVGRGGQSIARAVLDVPPPLDRTQLNRATRMLARKLMDGMTVSWHAMAEADRGAPADRRIEERDGRDRPAGPVAPTRPAPTTRPSAAPAEEPAPPAR